MRALMDDVGVRRAVRVARGPSGPRRATEFTTRRDGGARRVRRGDERPAGLAARPPRRPRRPLRRRGRRHERPRALPRQPREVRRQRRARLGAVPGRRANGGTAQLRDLTPYLNPGATDLSGPYAHAWSDINDSDCGHQSGDGHIVPLDQPDAGEAVGRTGTAASSTRSATSRPADPPGACDAAHKCSWNFDDQDELADQPRAERRPGLLLRQPLPRSPARRADLLQRRRRQLRQRRPACSSTPTTARRPGVAAGRTTATSTTRTWTRPRTAPPRRWRCSCSSTTERTARSATSTAATTPRSSTTSTRTA